VGTFSVQQTTPGVGVNQFVVGTLYMDNTWEPLADDVYLYVTWDPAVIQFISADWRLGNTKQATLNSPGELYLQFADFANKFPNGNTPVADINFRAVGEGTTSVEVRIDHVRSHEGTTFVDHSQSTIASPGTITVGAGGGGVTTVPTVPTVPVTTVSVLPTLTVPTYGTEPPVQTPTTAPVVTGGATGLPTPISTGTIPPLTRFPTGDATLVTTLPTSVPDGGSYPVQGSSGIEGYTGFLTETPTVNETSTVNETPAPTMNATPVPTPTEDLTAGPSITQLISVNPDLSTFVSAVQTAGLLEILNGTGPFTVFAPSNAAFDVLPPGALEGLRLDERQLTSVLTHHLATGRYTLDDIAGMPSIATVGGNVLEVNATGGILFIDGAKVTQGDVHASNGVIHVVDAVLLPPAANVTLPPTTPPMTGTSVPATMPVNTTATQAGIDALPLAAASLAALTLLAARRR